MRDILWPVVHLVMGDEVNISLKKVQGDRSILPYGCKGYSISKEAGYSFSLFILVSNLRGILGYSFSYDTNDRWMFLRHLKTYLEKYAIDDPDYIANTWHYFDQASFYVQSPCHTSTSSQLWFMRNSIKVMFGPPYTVRQFIDSLSLIVLSSSILLCWQGLRIAISRLRLNWRRVCIRYYLELLFKKLQAVLSWLGKGCWHPWHSRLPLMSRLYTKSTEIHWFKLFLLKEITFN